MPLPLIAGASLAAVATLAMWALTHPLLVVDLIAHRKTMTLDKLAEVLGSDDIVKAISDVICDYAEVRAGLVLDRADPLSDASMSAALGGRIGVPITSLHSVEGLKMDVARFAQGEIQTRSGLALTNIMDADAIRSDVGGFASGKVSEYVGVTITNVLDVDQTRSELTAWALGNFVDYVQQRLTEVAGGSVDLSGVGADTKQRLQDGLSSSEVLSQAFAGLVNVLLDKARRDLQRARRKEQNRQAQRRFRARHGCRMRYERLVTEGA